MEIAGAVGIGVLSSLVYDSLKQVSIFTTNKAKNDETKRRISAAIESDPIITEGFQQAASKNSCLIREY